jgi:hypothetical protein
LNADHPKNGVKIARRFTITRTCERALDAYEGFPHLYIKQRIAVALPNGLRAKAMAYVMNGPRQFCPASDPYLASIADGYRDFGFDDLLPLRAAQVEAISFVRRAERATWFDNATVSPPWAAGVAQACE